MERSSHIYQTYVEILRRELICAMGCTEPVAIAYCAAKARAILGVLPERMEVCASGNVIKTSRASSFPAQTEDAALPLPQPSALWAEMRRRSWRSSPM